MQTNPVFRPFAWVAIVAAPFVLALVMFDQSDSSTAAWIGMITVVTASGALTHGRARSCR